LFEKDHTTRKPQSISQLN